MDLNPVIGDSDSSFAEARNISPYFIGWEQDLIKSHLLNDPYQAFPLFPNKSNKNGSHFKGKHHRSPSGGTSCSKSPRISNTSCMRERFVYPLHLQKLWIKEMIIASFFAFHRFLFYINIPFHDNLNHFLLLLLPLLHLLSLTHTPHQPPTFDQRLRERQSDLNRLQARQPQRLELRRRGGRLGRN